MANFGGTITSGIQDISALLPLLGTEQCERHVGYALVDGYLYVAATPLSIFGSLGIFKAGFMALISSLNIRSVSGAQKLADAGFTTIDDSPLSMITIAEGRYVAETRLLSMLRDQHIDDVENLTLESDCQRWNWLMFWCSLMGPIISFSPYVYFILRDHSNHTLFTTWAFPIARALGSFLVALMVQFVIQHRVLTILKIRLIFMTMEGVVEQSKWGQEKGFSDKWSQSLPSEKCLRNLERHLLKGLARSNKESVDLEAVEPSSPAGTKTNPAYLQRKLGEEMEKHFSQTERRRRWLALPICQFLIFIGLGLSMIGYVGCFSIVQGSQNTAGPLLWLGLESALSFIRMFVWGWNPGFDDNTWLRFNLELLGRRPYFTRSKMFEKKIMADSVLPVAREQDFLEEITSCVGPLPRFPDNNVSLYYTYGKRATSNETKDRRVLCITVFDYKERDSVTLVKNFDFDSDQYTFFTSSLDVVHHADSADGPLTAKLMADVGPEIHHITADKGLLKALKEHCESVIGALKLTKVGNEAEIRALWTLRGSPRPTEDQDFKLGTSDGESLELELEKWKSDFAQGAGKWVLSHIEENKEALYDGKRYGEGLIFFTEWEEMEKMLFVESAVFEEQLKDEAVRKVHQGRLKRYNQDWAKKMGKRLDKESQRFQSRCAQVRSVPGVSKEAEERSRQLQGSISSKFKKTIQDLKDVPSMNSKKRWSSRRNRLKELNKHLEESIGKGKEALLRLSSAERDSLDGVRCLERWEQMEDRLRKDKDALIVRIVLKDLMPSSEESMWNFRKSRDKSIADLDKLGSKYFPVFTDADLALLVVAAQGLLSRKFDITAVHFHGSSLSQPTTLVRTKVLVEKMKSIVSYRNFPLLTPPATSKNIEAVVRVLNANRGIMSLNALGEDPDDLPERVIHSREDNRKSWEAQARTRRPDFDSIVFYEKPYIDWHDGRGCVGFCSDLPSGTSECIIYIYTRVPRTVGLNITYSCMLDTKFSIQFLDTASKLELEPPQVKEFAKSQGFCCQKTSLSRPLTAGFHILRLSPAKASEAPSPQYQCWLSDLEVVDATSDEQRSREA